MSALERIDQITMNVDAVNAAVFGNRSSFEAMLDAAVAGGPRLDVPSDPRALAIRAGTVTREEIEAADDEAARAAVAEPAADSAAPAASTPVVDETDGGGSAVGVTGAPPLPTGEWSTRLPERGQEWASAIEEAATRHGLEPELLGALVWSESAFDPQAVSSAGAIGLAQLMPGTAAELGVDPRDPLQHLEGGARYLRQQLDRFGSFELGLAAYNAGPTRVANAGGVPAIAETQAYVRVVLDRYVQLGGLA